jgi:hypothetical protein
MKWIIISILLLISLGLNIYYFSEVKFYKMQFHNIHLCLKDNRTTKDLYGSWINQDDKLECDYGIGNGLAQRIVLDRRLK